MSKAIYPGSFDPITLGHLDIIKRLASTFDEVIVLVADSSAKNHMFTAQERVSLASKVLKNVSNVQVRSYKGLTVEFAKQNGPAVLVRSLRGASDYDYERSLAEANRLLAPEIDTILMFSRPEFVGVASSLVKDIARNRGRLSAFVPKIVESALKEKIRGQK